MGDFFESDENPVGPCIWEGCDKPAIVTVESRVKPLVMDVCRDHVEKFLSASIVPGEEGDKIGISIPGTMGPDKSRLH